ncbi:Ig-like domain-containing protein, partial [Opitutales bacterium]|nr:Ig-like domain-containing protein [Opitutales bacterium]
MMYFLLPVHYAIKTFFKRNYFKVSFFSQMGVLAFSFCLFYSTSNAQTPGSLIVIEDSVIGPNNIIDLNATALGSGLTYVSFRIKAGEPANGQLVAETNGSDGRYYYIPNPDYAGSDSFDWNGTDSSLTVSTNYTFTITVTAVDDPPTLFAGIGTNSKTDQNGSSFTFTENQTLATTLLINDPDSTGFSAPTLGGADAAKFNIQADADQFTFHIHTNSALDFDNPPAGQTSFSLEVTATDGISDYTLAFDLDLINEDEPPAFSGAPSLSLTMSEDGVPTPWSPPTLYASDPDGTSLDWSITGAQNGTATFGLTGTGFRVIDYVPNNDFFGSDSFNVTVTSNGKSETKNISVTVVPVDDDDPAFTSPSVPIFVDENTLVVTTVSAVDPDSTTVSFAKDTSADWVYFNLVGGAITFKNAPDYETDPKLPGTYSIGVKATDSNLQTASQTLTVEVSDVPENPKLVGAGTLILPYPITLDEGGSWDWTSDPNLVLDLNITDDDLNQAQSLNWSISTNPEVGSAFITGTGSQPSAFTYTAEGNETGSYWFVVKVSDDTSPDPLTYEHNFSVTINPQPDDPILTHIGILSRTEFPVSNDTNKTIDVDEEVSTTIYLSAEDADSGDQLTFSISGLDEDEFDIDASSGDLTFKAGREPNFENPKDSNADGIYELLITVKDDSSDQLFDTFTLRLQTKDRNEPPSGITPTSIIIMENTTFVADLNATDIDFDDDDSTLSWELDQAQGVDNGKFAITSDGNLTFLNAPNFESIQDSDSDNTYEVGVKVTDTGGASSYSIISVTVLDDNDPPVITFNSTKIYDINEGSQQIFTFVGTDEDELGSNLKWSITDGNTSLFFIDPNSGALSFVSLSVLPNPDATGSAFLPYNLEITATDSGGLTHADSVQVRVLDVNEPPIIDPTYLTNGFLARSVAEEGTLTVSLTDFISDPENRNMTFNISTEGTLASSGSQTLTSAGEFNYTPNSDTVGTDLVQITITDEVDPGEVPNTVTLDISVTVTPVNDPPELTGGYPNSIAVYEGNASDLWDFDATDIDSDDSKLEFGLSGPDQSHFVIGTTSGILKFNQAPDHENKLDSDDNNTYEINITVKDFENAETEKSIEVRVLNVAEAPVWDGNNLFVEANEFEQAQYNIGEKFSSYTDAKYSLIPHANGASDEIAVVDSDTGVFTFKSVDGFSGDLVYDVNVSLEDVNEGSTNIILTIKVINVNDPPVIAPINSTIDVLENVSAVTTLQATDPNDTPSATTFIWTIGSKIDGTSDEDWKKFQIDTTTGKLSFLDPPDYEMDTSGGQNNIYKLRATVNDQGGGQESSSIDISVRVMPVDE